MSIELDKLPLNKHVRDEEKGKTKLLNSVSNIKVEDKRTIVEHKIPGMEGGVLQDLGREPVRISFNGIIYGDDAKDALEKLRAKFRSGKPVPFSSEISGVAEVNEVLIEDLNVEDVGGSPKNFKYSISLREYKPPPKKDPPAPSQDAAAQQSVDQKADAAKNEGGAGDDSQTDQQQDDSQADSQADQQQDTSSTSSTEGTPPSSGDNQKQNPNPP